MTAILSDLTGERSRWAGAEGTKRPWPTPGYPGERFTNLGASYAALGGGTWCCRRAVQATPSPIATFLREVMSDGQAHPAQLAGGGMTVAPRMAGALGYIQSSA